MIVKGILFDINGTLLDIHTDEGHEEIYRVLSKLLSYQGIALDPNSLKEQYYQVMKEQRAASREHHPEFDAVGIFREIITQHSTNFTRGLSTTKLEHLSIFLAETYRAVSRFQLQTYPDVEATVRHLHSKYRLAVVSDGQSAYATAELHAVGLLGYFDPIIISGDFGYRKPDQRLFTAALTAMNMTSSDVLFVGNDMHRDVYGAQRVGIKTIFFKSNQGTHQKDGVEPDYIIYHFAELLKAIHFFECQ